MRYLPHTEEEIKSMLQTVGVSSVNDLFGEIPENCRRGDFYLPSPMTEWQLGEYIGEVAGSTGNGASLEVLIGAGSYDHHIPESIKHLAGRSEFLTAYTPYQPEMAQGTLQGIFEYQTLTARLLGVDVANASIYDGASSLAEALLMGIRASKKRKTVAVSKAIHPHYRQVVQTYMKPTDYTVVELDIDQDGRTDLSGLAKIGDDLAAVAMQSPNFFGVVEELEKAGVAIHEAGAIFVSCFSEPLAYGLFKSPGDCGADIVCGEGQSFGLSQSFGGAGLGMFGCRQKFVRNMPGRLVGETTDLEGKRGYVLTLNTREQHIRREKATSNICSNQGVCALNAAMYMASLGGTGLRKLAKLNYDKAEYFKAALKEAGAELLSSKPTFNEFVVRFPKDFSGVHARLLDQGIVAGLALEKYYPEMAGCYLFGVTEKTTKTVMDQVVQEVRNG